MAEMGSFQLHPGDKAPEFSLPGVDGKTYRLSDYRTDPFVLVTFWCNHCPYVQGWESRMVEIGRKYGPKGVRIFLINSNDARAYPEDSSSRWRAGRRSTGTRSHTCTTSRSRSRMRTARS